MKSPVAKSSVKGRVWRPYRTYRFSGQDPMVSKVFAAMEQADTDIAESCRKSGVSPTTLHNWKNKKTRQPQFATLNATAMAMGYELRLTKTNGH